jgi:hypothetical protein
MKHMIILGCFCVLMSFGYGKAKVYQGGGVYVAKPVVLWKAKDPVRLTLAQKQAQALSLVYGLNENNVDSYRR